jgi:DNA invertase Pin-like site-specific DNA recombinase
MTASDTISSLDQTADPERCDQSQPKLTSRAASTTVDDMEHLMLTLADAANSDDPIVALRAIEKLRKEIDRVEAVAVRRARNANASWQLIALALGVSKQAVHKKYGRS